MSWKNHVKEPQSKAWASLRPSATGVGPTKNPSLVQVKEIWYAWGVCPKALTSTFNSPPVLA